MTVGVAQTRPVPAKSPEDHEASARIRAYLRREMEERGQNKAAACRWIGVNDGHFTRLMKGERTFSLGQALRISRVYGINMHRLTTVNPGERWFQGEEVPKEWSPGQKP